MRGTISTAYQHIRKWTRTKNDSGYYGIAQCNATYLGYTIEDIQHLGNEIYNVKVSGEWFYNISGKAIAFYDDPV